ncbi:MAG: LpxI family protein [bacterium]
MKKIGLIAGRGKLPLLWSEEAKKRGYKILAFPLVEKTYSLEQIVDRSFSINIGNLGKLIQTMKKQGIKQLIMLGKVEKKQLFSGFNPDLEMQKVLSGLENLSDENILKAVADRFEEKGIELLVQSTFLEHLLAEPGFLTTGPDKDLKADMEFGLEMAREIGRLDIGQTVIVKNKTVLAVEAVEGTDAALKRGGKLGREDVVMAKASRPHQDFRFDIPAVGLQTLENLKEVKAGGLVLEAGRTFIIDKKELIREAEKSGISIMAMEVEGNSNG